MEAKSFEAAWNAAQKIDGWLTRAEAAALYSAALATPAVGLIVEVGAYRGKSTVLLAHTGRRVITYDPLCEDFGEGNAMRVSEEDATALADNLAPYENVTWKRSCAREGSPPWEPVHLLYIDGDHREGEPLADFRHFEKSLAPGALVCFHDYGDRPAVGQAVGQLECEGLLQCLTATGTMYVARYASLPEMRARVFVARPYYDSFEPESADAEKTMAAGEDRLVMRIGRKRSSLLAHNFNDCVVQCLNTGGFDWFAMLHGDIAPDDRWLARMVAIAERRDDDVLHVVAPIKNGEGLSSTALAYSTDPWDELRRLTMTELSKLPETFDISDIHALLDHDARAILPNTGCLLVRTAVLEEFPGFAILDRIVKIGDKWHSQVVPEDWNFGFWCALRGFKVGATREIVLKHYGRQAFPNNDVWGMEVDGNWEQSRKAA